MRSIAATETVSEAEVFRFFEMQSVRAVKNHDGLLRLDEITLFAKSVSSPEANQR